MDTIVYLTLLKTRYDTLRMWGRTYITLPEEGKHEKHGTTQATLLLNELFTNDMTAINFLEPYHKRKVCAHRVLRTSPQS